MNEEKARRRADEFKEMAHRVRGKGKRLIDSERFFVYRGRPARYLRMCGALALAFSSILSLISRDGKRILRDSNLFQ